MYIPKPIDTNHVELPADLLQLTEKIAEQVHEIWAQGRHDAGWVYGEARDDGKKTTPCMVPYEELSEEEREYDRKTALATVRMIIALGYSIEKSTDMKTKA